MCAVVFASIAIALATVGALSTRLVICVVVAEGRLSLKSGSCGLFCGKHIAKVDIFLTNYPLPIIYYPLCGIHHACVRECDQMSVMRWVWYDACDEIALLRGKAAKRGDVQS